MDAEDVHKVAGVGAGSGVEQLDLAVKAGVASRVLALGSVERYDVTALDPGLAHFDDPGALISGFVARDLAVETSLMAGGMHAGLLRTSPVQSPA